MIPELTKIAAADLDEYVVEKILAQGLESLEFQSVECEHNSFFHCDCVFG